ncbi:MAG: hypothetical protein R8L07_04225 [Alphaproteobacteria bacterium]|nr:hypothetical protein [Alphaproteobacteria bacterium]
MSGEDESVQLPHPFQGRHRDDPAAKSEKDLRLLEARRHLIVTTRPVAEIAFAVGYESPIQFSWERDRKFGFPLRQERKQFELI